MDINTICKHIILEGNKDDLLYDVLVLRLQESVKDMVNDIMAKDGDGKLSKKSLEDLSRQSIISDATVAEESRVLNKYTILGLIPKYNIYWTLRKVK
jgi:hypothetical protein